MKLVVGNGGPQVLTSDCASDTWNPSGATTPVGYLIEGGAPPGFSNLSVYGCSTAATNSLGVTFTANGVTAPGTFTNGSAVYTDAQGAMWTTSGSFEVVITKLGGVGGTIEGTLKTSVIHPPSQVAQDVSASFTVCHIPDELTP